jgi:hypothetical protein
MMKAVRYGRAIIAVLALGVCANAGLPPGAKEPFIEPLQLYASHLYDKDVVLRIERARSEGKLSDELWLTLNAAARMPFHFELWDNAGELSCREARRLSRNSTSSDDRRLAAIRRETGLALVREFRCAVAVARGERACFLPGPDERLGPFGLGAVPNPAVTPLCFQSLCGEGFRSDERHKKVDEIARAQGEAKRKRFTQEFSWVDQDAANIDRIETYCRTPL